MCIFFQCQSYESFLQHQRALCVSLPLSFLTSDPDVAVTNNTWMKTEEEMEFNKEKTSSRALLSCGNGAGQCVHVCVCACCMAVKHRELTHVWS